MKTKIISALKTKYANRGFGDKAFDGVAEFLSKTVTEESQIEDAVSGVDGLLKAFQGDMDKVRGEKTAIQKELDELKAKGDGGEPTKPQPKDGGDDFDAKLESKLAALLEAKVKPLQEKVNSYEAEKAASARQDLITSKAKELGIPEWRTKQGFIIPETADETAIDEALTAIKQDIVTAGLDGSNRFPLVPGDKISKEEADKIAASMNV